MNFQRRHFSYVFCVGPKIVIYNRIVLQEKLGLPFYTSKEESLILCLLELSLLNLMGEVLKNELMLWIFVKRIFVTSDSTYYSFYCMEEKVRRHLQTGASGTIYDTCQKIVDAVIKNGVFKFNGV